MASRRHGFARARRAAGHTQESLAYVLGVDRSTIFRWEAGDTEPLPSLRRTIAHELGITGGELAELIGDTASGGSDADPILLNDEGISWISVHSALSYEQVYEAVSLRVAAAQREMGASRGRQFRRSRVGRTQIAAAMRCFYDESQVPFVVGQMAHRALPLSMVSFPEWYENSVLLGGKQEQIRFVCLSSPVQHLDGLSLDAALDRLADAELVGTELYSTQTYRLLSFHRSANSLQASVATIDSLDYIFTLDLLETELIEGIVGGTIDRLHLREGYLPKLSSVVCAGERLCVGGPLALFAAARPASGRPGGKRDYVLLVQHRSKRVINVPGRLAVIPKMFHKPLRSAPEDVALSRALQREVEEELLGRCELENSPTRFSRKADPLHMYELSEPMRWLAERQGSDNYRMECTGFGFNTVSGNYEFACLIVIEDEEWWVKFGGAVETNWEVGRLQQYSSHDADGLVALAFDEAWSNEGLFALLLGLRRLATLDPSRVTLPCLAIQEDRVGR